MKNNGNFVIALDISRKMVLEARRRGVKAYQCDIENEDIPIRYKFNVILMTEVLEHFLDPIPILRKIKRNLKKEGLLYISTPNCAYWYNRFQLLMGRVPNFGEKNKTI
ncbi:MAG: class I SAM-dependent methyltransferase [Candidatus Aenigmatarchaeota archaeon]